jgi:hypothetical protein
MKLANLEKNFLLDRDDPNYPPHHTGDHLEEYFIKFWEAEGSGFRKLIPVHWTAVYNYKVKEGLGEHTPNGKLRKELQKYLSSLDPNENYFIVCSHDDAPSEMLPPNTKVFAAGGNSSKIDVEIPLTCAPHVHQEDCIRTIPISFVGSLTHPVRRIMAKELHQKPGVFMNASEWSPNVPPDSAELFKQITLRSIFSLCPRGYGTTSYRLYEAIQLGAIPIYVSDKHALPWKDELNWNEFCFIIKPSEIQNIHQIVLSSKGSKIRKIQDTLQETWEKYFSISATCKNIYKRVNV